LTRPSTPLRDPAFLKTWMAGSSPAKGFLVG
jgi:hypothetical protein